MSDPITPEETEPRISVTLNVPEAVFKEIEAYTRAKWPAAKRAPRWIALLRTGFELTKEIDAGELVRLSSVEDDDPHGDDAELNIPVRGPRGLDPRR